MLADPWLPSSCFGGLQGHGGLRGTRRSPRGVAAIWNDSSRFADDGKLSEPAVSGATVPSDSASRDTSRGYAGHDSKHHVELGPRQQMVPLDSGRHDHRHAGLWLVDESYPGAGGSLFLSLDPRRYRLRGAVADGGPPDLAGRE